MEHFWEQQKGLLGLEFKLLLRKKIMWAVLIISLLLTICSIFIIFYSSNQQIPENIIKFFYKDLLNIIIPFLLSTPIISDYIMKKNWVFFSQLPVRKIHLLGTKLIISFIISYIIFLLSFLIIIIVSRIHYSQQIEILTFNNIIKIISAFGIEIFCYNCLFLMMSSLIPEIPYLASFLFIAVIEFGLSALTNFSSSINIISLFSINNNISLFLNLKDSTVNTNLMEILNISSKPDLLYILISLFLGLFYFFIGNISIKYKEYY